MTLAELLGIAWEVAFIGMVGYLLGALGRLDRSDWCPTFSTRSNLSIKANPKCMAFSNLQAC